MKKAPAVFCLLLAAACSDLENVGKAPALTPPTETDDYLAMTAAGMQPRKPARHARASLWHSGPTSLLGDRRARNLGDLLTVVIQINDKAEMSNSSTRSRQGSQKLAMPSLFGLPQSLDSTLPAGATSANAVDVSSNSTAKGTGTIKRKEKLTLRIAATVTRVLPNGYLEIHGTQEVRINNELRALLVSGFVRPEDISRANEITYDRIASARISYGGRGMISSVQKPRVGQQILEHILPF